MQADLAPATKREMVDWAKAELIYEGKKKKSNRQQEYTTCTLLEALIGMLYVIVGARVQVVPGFALCH
jgi:23S rRNA maturation mini-RNase III